MSPSDSTRETAPDTSSAPPRSRLDGVLADLLHSRRTAALATLDDAGGPAVSLVPYALDPARGDFIVRISALAAHTRHLRRHPRAALLIAEGEDDADNVHALSRVAIDIEATFDSDGSPDAAEAARLYLARHPAGAVLAELPDFAWVRLHPLGARQVAGFGAARSVEATRLISLMQDGPSVT
jgi:hypothetical protein